MGENQIPKNCEFGTERREDRTANPANPASVATYTGTKLKRFELPSVFHLPRADG
jgi:hypothetical protein